VLTKNEIIKAKNAGAENHILMISSIGLHELYIADVGKVEVNTLSVSSSQLNRNLTQMSSASHN
jgi:hypothetical protein